MAGQVIQLAGKTQYDGSKVQGSQNQAFLVAERIDVSQYREANLVVRYHEGTIGASATVTVGATAEGHTAEDPGLTFRTDPASPLAEVSLTSNDSAPLLKIADVTSPFGSMLSVFVLIEQPASPVTVQPSLSIDLVLKE